MTVTPEVVVEADTATALASMFEQPPVNWWRFVPCDTCNALRQEPCRKGGDSWPEPALRPHAARVSAARVLHGTLWLLTNGFAEDVLGGPESKT